MTQIDIASGETEEIIPQDQANREYIVEVNGNNPVRIGHTHRYAKDGTTLENGTNHRIDNLRGEKLYAHAHAGATSIRVTLAAANVDSQPTRDVTVVEGSIDLSSSVDVDDRAAREIGKARLQDSTGTLIDPATSSDISATQPRKVTNMDGTSATSAAAGTGSANAAAITVPDGCRTVTIGYDTSGAATVTVEVSPDSGTTWYPLTTYSPGSAATNADTIETGFDDVRAYIDANLNSLHIGAKGA